MIFLLPKLEIGGTNLRCSGRGVHFPVSTMLARRPGGSDARDPGRGTIRPGPISPWTESGGRGMPEARINGVRLHYEIHGSGGPLVLVHEFAGDSG